MEIRLLKSGYKKSEQFYKDFYDSFNAKDFIEHEDGSIETVELEPIIRKIYDNIKLPKRATIGSAGYDFFCPFGFTDCIYDPNYLEMIGSDEDIEHCKKECLKEYVAGKETDTCLFYAY